MRKLLLLVTCLLFGSTASVHAQIAGLQEREIEWKNYTLPQANFTRHVSPGKTLVFRVPAGWKQEEGGLIFWGPNSARLHVSVQTVPDGYPLLEYVAAVLKEIGTLRGSSEGILTRRTHFQDLEAREIHLETQDPEGNVFRSTTWITISGPLTVSVNLVAPVAHASAMEPFLKATVQSVMFVPANFAEFEAKRLEAMKTPAAGPIHEIQTIVASLNELNSDREAAINRLTPLFLSQPDAAVDLLIDRRVAVRSAAAEALARSKNVALRSFLWHVLDDPDPFVAEAAARPLATGTDIVSELLNRAWTTKATQTFARVWPFMTKEDRIRFFQDHFNQTLPDRTVQTGSLLLLRTMRPDEFKLPLARILAANHEPLTIVGLRVANDRGESLPVDSLMKLAASRNEKIKRLAVESLGQSAAVSDIPRMEALSSKTPIPASAKDKDKEALARKAFDEELKLSIKKIRLRNDLSLAKSAEERREIIRKASSDASLDDFAWRFDCEATDTGCAPATAPRNLPPDFKIKSFAENLFPQKVTHYTAIPNPGQSVQRFHATLHGLQLDSPRAQANLILVMGSLREKLGQELGAPPDAAAVIDYTGIKSDSPIVFGSWTAAGARDSVVLAQRKAIVLRVKDRARFERVLDNFQQATGHLMYLTDYVAMGTRAAAALPALLPLSAQAVLSTDLDESTARPFVSYSFVGRTEWNGIPIKTIEHRWLNYEWNFNWASTYVAFIGDVAILTDNVASIRDLLSNAATPEQQLLAGNEEFRRAVGTDGDVVYFSDLKAVFADPNDKSFDEVKKANESGALKFSTSSWENAHRLVFDESEWSKALLPFHPKELSAPRELLPSSTLAYFMMKLDVAAAWQHWPKTMNLRDNKIEIDASFWSLDFNKEVLPELGPECGVALLDLPNIYEKDFAGVTWAGYCKLKTNKLSEAFAAGKLLRGVGPTGDTAEIKDGETSYFIGIRNGFLVVSNKSNGPSVLGGKTNLAAARDYSKAAEKAPAGIVAFAGYNLEAAVAAAGANAKDGLRAQIAGMVFSVASAFHSQSFFATANAGGIEGRSSVAMDREGRYAVADFNYLPRGANITYATLQPHGMPIFDQNRLSNIVLKVRAKAPGPIDSIRDDIKSATQTVEQKSANELVITVAARRPSADKKIQLPVTNPEVSAFLKATGEITSDNQNVINQAREIAGEDRDAWSVAQKLADWTHKNLEWKSVARAGAAETLATREADCSEFSQLYVSMARSLGLPARIVSGLAYSGNSFGGHAWVEVWIGEWIELDPTWGTHFVDATHIRNEASTLVTAAALNLIDLEVLETRRTIAEFQKSPKTLVAHFAKAVSDADTSDVEATFDLATLTDELMGAGAWNGLNGAERDQMSAAYRRVLKEIIDNYSYDEVGSNNIHLLHLEEKSDRAEAVCYVSDQDLLIKLRLLRRNDVWYLHEVVQPDPGFHLAAERFGPIIKSIEASRAGKKTTPGVSDVLKVSALIDSDPEKAVAETDRLLQTKSNDQTYRFLKMIALWEADKKDESVKLLTELSNEQPANAPAVLRLAGYLSEANPEQAIELYKRYLSLEPYDPRGYRELGRVHETTKQTELAEAAYRKAIAVDPFEIPGYKDLAIFLVLHGRVAEVGAVLAAADKYATDHDEDVLLGVLSELEEEIKLEDAEQLAASEAQRFKTDAWTNLALSDIYMREKRYPQAIDLAKRAIQIEPNSAYTHLALSAVYLKQSRLNEALKTVDHSLTLGEDNAFAHYRRATILARLGRRKEAMTALEKSIELNSGMLMAIAEEEDFNSLRTLPAFKKLLAEAEKQAEQADPK